MASPLRRLPWHATVWGNAHVVPGFVRAHVVGFWDSVILKSHPLRDTLVSYLRDGVDLNDLLLDPFRGTSSEEPYNRGRCPPAAFANRIPLEFDDFVDTEMQSLLSHEDA